MPTVAELKSETQSLLKKAGKATAHSEDLTKWYNELLRRLQRHVRREGTWQLTVSSGTEQYSLAVSTYPILTLDQVLYVPTGETSGSELDIVTLSERWVDNTIRFKKAVGAETNHTLWVWPTTLAGTLELYGLERLDTITSDDDIPAIDEDFHDLFPLWGAARFGGQDEDFGGAGRHGNFMSEFLRREQDFIKAMAEGSTGTGSFKPEVRW